MTESASTALHHASGAGLARFAGTWTLDPNATTIEFHSKAMWGAAKVKGTFAAVSGGGSVGDQGAVSGELVIDATSVDTGNKRRDKHLRGRDFFDVSAYPTFSFNVSEAAPSTDGTLRIEGQLRIKDRSQPIEVVATSMDPSPDRLVVNGEATIDRSAWGMTWARMGAHLVNRVVVSAQFVRS
jgi:polyisoprenoid-binding protein YceI